LFTAFSGLKGENPTEIETLSQEEPLSLPKIDFDHPVFSALESITPF
jgi:hypothetical protein